MGYESSGTRVRFLQQTLIAVEVFRRRTALRSEPQNCLKNNHNNTFKVVTLRLAALLFGPSVIPPPLLDISCVAKQYLAKTLLTSRECICCKATMIVLKNPKIRRRRERLGGCGVFSDTTLFSLDSFGWSRAGCNVSVYLCILYQCVFDQYILFSRLFSISILPLLMYTYHDDNDVFKKKISFSLSKISKHKSLFRNDDNTKKKDKKKVNVHIKG